jgi:hypothetical protein
MEQEDREKKLAAGKEKVSAFTFAEMLVFVLGRLTFLAIKNVLSQDSLFNEVFDLSLTCHNAALLLSYF